MNQSTTTYYSSRDQWLFHTTRINKLLLKIETLQKLELSTGIRLREIPYLETQLLLTLDSRDSLQIKYWNV